MHAIWARCTRVEKLTRDYTHLQARDHRRGATIAAVGAALDGNFQRACTTVARPGIDRRCHRPELQSVEGPLKRSMSRAAFGKSELGASGRSRGPRMERWLAKNASRNHQDARKPEVWTCKVEKSARGAPDTERDCRHAPEVSVHARADAWARSGLEPVSNATSVVMIRWVTAIHENVRPLNQRARKHPHESPRRERPRPALESLSARAPARLRPRRAPPPPRRRGG